MPSSVWNAIAWNSLCAPLPISAIVRESGRASAGGEHRRGGRAQRGGQREFGEQQRVAGIDFGERAERHHRVHSARGIDGWPFTYLNANSDAFATGISSITPSREWHATRGDLSKSAQCR